MRFLYSLAAAAVLTLPVYAQQPACTPETAVIYAGQTTPVGSVSMTNTIDHLRIDVEINAPWYMHELHVYVGSGPLPTTGGGNVAPGQFPFQWTFNPNGTREFSTTIPFSQFGLGCNDTALVAVHVVVCKMVNQVPMCETGWAFGNPFGGSQWGWSFDYFICCTECGSSIDLNLTAQPLQTGTNVDLTVDNAIPGETVWFAYSCKPTVCDAGPSFASLGGLKLDLGAPVQLIGSAVADGLGVAVLSAAVPPPTAVTVGKWTNLQAVAKRGLNGADSVKSNALTTEIL